MSWRRAVRYSAGSIGSRGASVLALSVIMGFILAVPAAAQLTTGNIVGNLVDDTKASLPGAAVTIKNVDTGLTRTLFTDRQGRFEAPNLPGGTYEVTATMQGFGTAVRRGIDLAVGRTAVVDITLPLGSVRQLNRANFGTPDMTAFINGERNPNAGRISKTRTPARQAQLGVRWIF